MKWLAIVLICVASLFVAGRAQAVTTCSVTSITTLAFPAVQPTGSAVDTVATINYSCTYTGGLLGGLYGVYLTGCLGMAPDDQGAVSPRTMINASNDRMRYDIYKDSQRTSVLGPVGNATYAPLPFQLQFTILSNPQTQTGSATVYGRIPTPQPSLSPGNYSATLAGGATANGIAWRYNEALLSLGTFPAGCQTGGGGGGTAAGPSSTVTSSVAKACTITTATALDFGNVPGFLRTPSDQTSLLRMTCTNRSPFQVGLDNGQNASGSTRRMASGSGFVAYELYRDSQRTQRWGNTINSDTATGTGSGSEQTLTVYGRVPVQPAAAAGGYSDTVTVTVTY
ncbi:Spore coat protein U (SCPU) domain-containing protein [Luteibacter sp. UNC138MFCol5.1]|uniref:Csu type fimbrial protein n=1 Tax=Luteibacter sp. UNC138MFCol5.1 TaxID=1502774 RepID=UPI0008D73F82|nr:spore coat U domain-containing protein [Luteibacter sp. UNC138MFCol5.1]SEO42145.1 Spore coat protein U (SCPU) domain-containing protein [Luteibacter sp. UNC138MFCol5.1]